MPQLNQTITDEAVSRAFAKFAECCIATRDCPRCKGEGFHHGFGDNGQDPDWCEECHGSQYVPQYSDKDAMRLAIIAALDAGETYADPSAVIIEAGARAICQHVGGDPDQKTYAHEMKCTGHDREPAYRWEYWAPFARAVLSAAIKAQANSA